MDGFKKYGAYSLVSLPLPEELQQQETSHAQQAQIKASKTALFTTLQKRLTPPPLSHTSSNSNDGGATTSAAIVASGGADIIEPFSIPDLKIGTLDAILLLADELTKSDALFENLLNKIVDQLRTLLASDADTLASVLTIGDRKLWVSVGRFASLLTLCCRLAGTIHQTLPLECDEVPHRQ